MIPHGSVIWIQFHIADVRVNKGDLRFVVENEKVGLGAIFESHSLRHKPISFRLIQSHKPIKAP